LSPDPRLRHHDRAADLNRPVAALLYVAISVGGGVLGAAAGYVAGRSLS